MATDPVAAPCHSSAFSDAYDDRRSWRALNQQSVDKNVDDHTPACPRCWNLLPHGSIYCAECGCKVTI